MFLSKYAVIQIADKQFLVSEGDEVKVFKSNITTFDTLLFKDGSNLELGNPVLTTGGVELTYTGDKRVKTEVRRYKGKSRYRINKSHTDVYAIYTVSKLDLKTANKIVEQKQTTPEVKKTKEVEKKLAKPVIKKVAVKKSVKKPKSVKSVKKGVK